MNLTGLQPNNTGGMEIYVRSLIEGYAQLDDAHEYRILAGSAVRGITPQRDRRFSEFTTDSRLPKAWQSWEPIGHFWQYLPVMRELHRFHPDIHHCPMNVSFPPWRLVGKTVITLHDVKFVTNPEMLRNRPIVAYLRFCWRRGFTFARKIITDSFFSKQAIIDSFPVDPDLVQVVYLGVNPHVFHKHAVAPRCARDARLAAPYLFYPAGTWPHKNHVRLLQALALLRDRKRIAVNLVLTGFPQTAQRDVTETLARLRLDAQVIWLGWISTPELVSVYQHACALVFPSLYEGFGLPLIEAMACGCPVLCSRTTACAEVAGPAALTFDPEDVDDLAARMETICTNAMLREEMIANGLQWSAKFTCSRMARETLNVFAAL